MTPRYATSSHGCCINHPGNLRVKLDLKNAIAGKGIWNECGVLRNPKRELLGDWRQVECTTALVPWNKRVRTVNQVPNEMEPPAIGVQATRQATIVAGFGFSIVRNTELMKESAMAARSYLWSHASELGIDPEMIKENGVHLHVPAGAIP